MGCLGCIWCQKRLRLSWKVDECKPMLHGVSAGARRGAVRRGAGGVPHGGGGAQVGGGGRGLHSSTSHLNLSRVRHKKTPYTR